MPASIPVALPLLLLLVGASTAAQPATAPGERADTPRVVMLSATAPKEVPEVPIQPGRLSTFLLGAPLKLVGVELEEREGFSRVTLLEDMLTLLPSGALPVGRRLKLRLRFMEGTVPASADFVLVVSRTQVETQVEVNLQPGTPYASWQEAEAERIKLRQVQAELERERQEPDGLTGLLAEGRMDEEGVPARRQYPTQDFTQLPGQPLTVRKATSYRARGVVALALEVDNVSSRPWKAVGASLVDEGGVRLKVLRVWPTEPLAPGATRQRVVVEAEVTEEARARGRFTLSLWQEGEPASVSLEGVTFP
ncbi:DUF2381 family protein [Archangium sp.]|uniref:DUF2381 family protein n=1 Tax=Archangium sp. TaxID=1872627 RepID=UPI00286C2514|nr:DUF2381 family protein [Archangium sp.]